MAAPTMIFNFRDIADHLSELRAADPDGPWWTDVYRIAWSEQPRKGNNAIQRVSVYYTDRTGVMSRMTGRFNLEIHTGQIMPNTEEGLAELKTEMTTSTFTREYKIRANKPNVQVMRFQTQVVTEEDGVTICKGPDGKELLPDSKYLSAMYCAIELMSIAFRSECESRIENGVRLVTLATAMKKKNKALTAAEVSAEFGPFGQGDVILSSESVINLRKLFPAPKDVDLMIVGAIIGANIKIATPVQEYISSGSKSAAAGQLMSNPIARIGLGFTDAGDAITKFYNGTKTYQSEGRTKYDAAQVDGVPVNANNIHKFLQSRSPINGIVSCDSVCFSGMGISIPMQVVVLIVEPPVSTKRDISDINVFEDGGGTASAIASGAYADAGTYTNAAADTAPVAAPAAAAPAADTAAAEENFDAMLSSLQVT